MIKKLIVLLAPGLFILAAACSGGKEDKAPPMPIPNPTAADQQALNDLYQQALRAKQSCTQDYTPVFQQVALMCLAAQQQGNPAMGALADPRLPILLMGAPGGGSTMGGFPGGGSVMGGIPGTPGGPAIPQPQGQACNNDLMNLVMAFTTIRLSNGQLYANMPQAQQWLAQTLAGITDNVGGNLMSQGINVYTDAILRNCLLTAANQQVRTQVIPRLGAAAPAAQQGLDLFVGIY